MGLKMLILQTLNAYLKSKMLILNYKMTTANIIF